MDAIPTCHIIPGTKFVVDFFKFGNTSVTAYFLSHAHADHYGGISENWQHGTIYCSEQTSRLIQHFENVKARADTIVALPMEVPTIIQGVEVTLVDANHCPGAVQFLFKLPDGRKYIHCGDMRFSPHLTENVHLQRFVGPTAVFLDTTYCKPQYTFPPQEEVVQHVALTMQKLMEEDINHRRLYLIQTYCIGKERLFLQVAEHCKCKLYVNKRKYGIISQLDLPGVNKEEIFTTDPKSTWVHLLPWGTLGEAFPFFKPNYKIMEEYGRDMGADEVIGWVPTGWTYEHKKNAHPVKKRGNLSIHLVPYSEHSSYSELVEYIKFLKPQEVIPTVGVEGKEGEKRRRAILKRFSRLVDQTSAKAKFLRAFQAMQDSDAVLAETAEDGGRGAGADDAEDTQEAASEEGEEEAGQSAEAGVIQGAPEQSSGSMGFDRAASGAQPQDLQDQEIQTEEAAGVQGDAGVGEADVEISSSGDGDRESGGDPPELVELVDSYGADSTQKLERIASGVQAGTSTGLEVVNNFEETLEQLMGILGEGCSLLQARQLLYQAGGDLQHALNLYCDRPSAGAASESLPKQDTGGNGTVSASSEPPGRPQKKSTGPTAKSAKRKVPTASKQGTASASKRGKAEPSPGKQRTIASFFTSAANSKIASRTSTVAQEDNEPEAKADLQLTGSKVASPGSTVAQEDNQAEAKAKIPLNGKNGETIAQLLEEADRAGQSFQAVADEDDEAVVSLLGEDGEGGAAVKLEGGEEPVAPQKRPRQLGAFATASAPSVGVSNALIEKRKAGMRRAGGAQETTAAEAANGKAAKKEAEETVTWQEGTPAPYLVIARAFAAMESTTKRLAKDNIMVEMFRNVLRNSPDDVVATAYLTMGKIAPEHEGTELNVGGSIISTAIREATGVSRQKLHALYNELGDPGDVAEACRHTQTMLIQPAPLTVRGVFKSLHNMAKQKGAGATARRRQTILHLLRSCRDCETRYLVRTLVQNLRVGANWRSVIGSLARAVLLESEKASRPPKARLDAAASAAVEAFHVCPSLDLLVAAMLEPGGVEHLDTRISLTPGVPLKPMLASITEGVGDAIQQLQGQHFLAEYKYDGIRAQIHLHKNGDVRIFSRNCEERTGSFPDVADAVRSAAAGGCHEVVLDAELVAVDREKANELKSFQELSTRARGAITALEVKVPVCVFAFDCLFVDGQSLLKRPLQERRERLAAALPNLRPGFVCLAQSHVLQAPTEAAAPEQAQLATAPDATAASPHTSQQAVVPPATPEHPAARQPSDLAPGGAPMQVDAPDESLTAAVEGVVLEAVAANEGAQSAAEAGTEALIREHLQDALAAGTEGLMLKALTGPSATYQPSKRSNAWLKIKRDYCEELRDSLDLVPIGAWHGNGRKVGWYSPFLLAAWDPDAEEFQSVCRCMSGFSDAFYAQAKERLDQHRIDERKDYYNTNERPSVWFEPTEVWELRGADLTLSAVHKAAFGLIHPTRGVSLRFPRFVRMREDKRPEEASGPDVIRQLFNAQTRKLVTAREAVAKRDGKANATPAPAVLDSDEDGAVDNGAEEELAMELPDA